MKKWLEMNKRVIGILSVVLLVVLVGFSPQSAPLAHANIFTLALQYAASQAINWVISPIVGLILGIASWLLYFTSALLNTVVEKTIVTMTIPTSLNDTWRVLRDLANMIFIFILLYIAIGTILRLDSVHTKKMLVHVIIVALLINFSLFFTKVIIDASNVVTIGFYKSVMATNPNPGGGIGAAFVPTSGIAGQIQAKLGISTLLDPVPFFNSVLGVSNSADRTRLLLLNVLGGTLIIVITSFVLVAASVLFLIRYVVLLILMVLSPLAYIAYIVPTMQQHSKKWWDTLIKNCLFPPLFMLLLWVSLQLMPTIIPSGASFGALGGTVNPTTGKVDPPSTGTFSLIFSFGIGAIFLVSTIILSKELGAVGAKTVSGWGKNLRTGAQGFLGRTAVRATGIATLDKKFRDSSFGQTFVGRGLRNISTGALTETKFGSKDSVQSADKEEKELNKKYATKQYDDMVDNLNDLSKKGTPDKPANILEHRRKKADDTKKIFEDYKNSAEYGGGQTSEAKAKYQKLEKEWRRAEDRRNDTSMASADEEREFLKPVMEARVAKDKKALFSRQPLKWIRRNYLSLEKNAKEQTVKTLEEKIRHKQTTADEIAEKLKEYETGGAPSVPEKTPPPAPPTPPASTPPATT